MAGEFSASGSSGTSANKSQSTSTPSAVETPESQWGLQLSQLLSNIGQGQYDWATNQFNTAQGVTDEQINNYLNNANASLGQSNDLWNQYQNTFAPIMNQYAQEAQTWASPSRINFNEGQAETTAGQAADQASNAAKQQLMDFGVNPSSGMYGELTAATNAQKAASQASAGTEAGLQTENTGQQMLLNSAQMGQQLPGQSVNAMNAAYQGISGAENSILGLENTGATLMDSASPYFSDAAAADKLPATGTTSQSSSTGQSQNASGSASAPGTQGGGGGGGGSAPSNGAAGPGNGGYYTQPQSTGAGPSNINVTSGSGSNGGGGGADASDLLSQTETPDYNMTGGGATYTDGSGGDFGGGYAGGGDIFVQQGASLALGGVLPDHATTGGYVPPSASPSQGRQTDDIPARLNAKEFVIPRDVVEWKGSEFFKKLIEQSRKARGVDQKPIGGQMKPMLPGAPRFISHRMASPSGNGGSA
jgi:hypothetical protein